MSAEQLELEAARRRSNLAGGVRRIVSFFDPKICPTCFSPATTLFGARYYCGGCADQMGSFVRGVATPCL